MRLIILCIFSVFITYSYAWWCEGHRLGIFHYQYHIKAYEIARQQLTLEKKEHVMKFVDNILFNMTEHDAGKISDMIPCWMDDIKDKGGMYWSGIFHYVDIPYFDTEYKIDVQPQANASGALVFFLW